MHVRQNIYIMHINIIRKIHLVYLKLRGQNKNKIDYDGKILIVAPHPDDEALGCGGLISRLCAEKNPPHIAVLTGGGGSLRGRSDISETEVVNARRKLTLDSANQLGLTEENIHFFDFRDGDIGTCPEKEMSRLRQLINNLSPDNILVPHNGEGWPDHLAARNIGIELAPKNAAVWEYCVWMWYYNVWNLDWKNAAVLRMSDTEHSSKLRAVDAYVKPLAPCGAPWSGELPKQFLKANKSKIELYFKLTK